MRGLKRNETPVYYRRYIGTEDAKDDYGHLTGEKVLSYADPVSISASVSPASGRVSEQLFGTSLDYDYTILSHDKELPIHEEDLILLGSVTCAVSRIARSLNVLVIAVKRVNADGP